MPLQVAQVDPVRSWQAHVRAMAQQWSEIYARRTGGLVAAWQGTMSEMRRQHHDLVAGGLWLTGPSDFLAIVDLARHENTHSRVLEWLLTPTARHGLGCGLVRRLVTHCTGKPAPAPLAVTNVKFSQWRNDREADLVVWGEEFTLVIENKVDADEQPRQCEDLYENFRSEIAPLFLFLTPGGREPRTATTPAAQRAFNTISWRELRAMIETTLGEPRPATGATDAVDVVVNYLRTLEEQFG